MPTANDLAQAIERIAGRIDPIRDELNAADRHLGDGDTGMTVADVVAAWQAAAPALPPDVGAALLALGRGTSRATGSSLGAVLAMGLSAAGRSVRGKDALAVPDIRVALAAATAAITGRSGAAGGDKTILDSLLQIEAGLAAADPAATADPLAVATGAAEAALSEFRPREARIGRARMYGAKSAGHDDPGMLAACLLLRAAAPG